MKKGKYFYGALAEQFRHRYASSSFLLLALSTNYMHLFITLVRSYATASTRSSRLPSPKPPLSLDHFLLRQRTISLYRTIVRACHKIPPPTREEMKKYAREEFERHKAVEDLRKIRYLISTGRTEFERLGKQVSGMD